MSPYWRRPCGLLRRRAAKGLLWAVALVVAAVGANIAGIHFLGSVAGWERWLAASSGYFFAWRLCLYGATACGWMWMRRRLLAREAENGADALARWRLIRSEVAGLIAVVALEVSLVLQG